MPLDQPCWYEYPADPVVLDDAAHGRHALPLPGAAGVVVGGELLDHAAETGHSATVAEVGHEDVSVLDEDAGG